MNPPPAAVPASPGDDADDAPRIGVSSCLLGEAVRYDRGHKRDRFLTDELGLFVRFVPVCPEVEAGMGLPRPPVRLERLGGEEEARMVDPVSGADHTAAMHRFAARRARELAKLDLDGYVLKAKSPSCGMERVKVYGKGGVPAKAGRGLFAEALMERLPLLPVEEEGRLHDARLREGFVERIFAYRRLRRLFSGRWTMGQLVDFHSRHKLQLLSHSPADYRALGKLVARGKQLERSELRSAYERGFMEGMNRKATPGKHMNTLLHILGYFRRDLEEGARAELLDSIEQYRAGRLPLVVPVTLLGHHARRLGIGYLTDQTYLQPHPRELMLRNHV